MVCPPWSGYNVLHIFSVSEIGGVSEASMADDREALSGASDGGESFRWSRHGCHDRRKQENDAGSSEDQEQSAGHAGNSNNDEFHDDPGPPCMLGHQLWDCSPQGDSSGSGPRPHGGAWLRPGWWRRWWPGQQTAVQAVSSLVDPRIAGL